MRLLKISLLKNSNIKKIRILVDAHVFDEFFQGSRTFIKGLYSALINKRCDEIEIYFCAFDISNLKKEFGVHENVYFIKLTSKNKFIRLIYEIPKILRKHKINFAHFNYYVPLFKPKNCKYIVTIHDVLFLDYPNYFPKTYYYKNKYFFKRSVKRSEIITTVSEYSKERMMFYYDLNNKDVKVLSNAVSEEFFWDYDTEKAKERIKEKYGFSNYICYVSRIEPRKNHKILLQAYQELELWKKGISLVFIGKEAIEGNKLFTSIQNINDQNGQWIHHLENLSNQELIDLYLSSILFVFPSICEGFGIPPLESGALRIPTICSNYTAMKEFTFFDKNHIDTNNVEEIKKAINRIINSNYDKNHYLKIAQQIKINYNWENSAEKLLSLILDQK